MTIVCPSGFDCAAISQPIRPAAPPRKSLGDDAADGILGAAGRGRHDQPEGAAGEAWRALCERRPCNGHRGQGDSNPVPEPHFEPSSLDF